MTVLTRAIQARTLDEAVKPIQDALGITDGGVASMAFSALPNGDDSWPELSFDERRRMLADWLLAELNHA